MNKKLIFALYAVDEWKSQSSKNLIIISTDINKIIKQIKEEIKKNNMIYFNENYSTMKQIISLNFNTKDLGKKDIYIIINDINIFLENGIIEIFEDGYIY